MKEIAFDIFITLILILLIGCEKGSKYFSHNSNRRNNFTFNEGKRLFEHYCAPCHGETGDGLGKYYAYGLEPQPPDFTDPEFLFNRNNELLYLNIQEGSVALGKSNLCPPWGYTFRLEEIECLVTYIKKINEDAINGQNEEEIVTFN
jgi:hypothetical protein